MADGVSEHQNILTIGFLNDQVRQFQLRLLTSRPCVFCFFFFKKKNNLHPNCQLCVSQVEERKDSYVNSFDIVLVRDETMDVPNAILRFITSSGANK